VIPIPRTDLPEPDLSGTLDLTPSSDVEDVLDASPPLKQRKRCRRSLHRSQSFELVVPVLSPRDLLRRTSSGGISSSSSPSGPAASQKSRRSRSLRRSQSANDAFSTPAPVLNFAAHVAVPPAEASKAAMDEGEETEDLVATFKAVLTRADGDLLGKLRSLDVDSLEALLRR
jgi:hypothetical protein